MIDTAKPLEFFLGANTPQGFVSRFDQLADPADGWREFVIKGGPGTGKSTLMKRIAAEVGTRGGQVELIHCASDVDALDAVIFPAIKTAIADGTAPHGMGAIAPIPCGERLRAGYPLVLLAQRAVGNCVPPHRVCPSTAKRCEGTRPLLWNGCSH